MNLTCAGIAPVFHVLVSLLALNTHEYNDDCMLLPQIAAVLVLVALLCCSMVDSLI